MTTEFISATRQNLSDHIDRSHTPVAWLDDGAECTVETLDALGQLEPPAVDGRTAPRALDPWSGHCLTGPIAIRGAEPGSFLAVELLHIEPSQAGFTEVLARSSAFDQLMGIAPHDHKWMVWNSGDHGITTDSIPNVRPIPVRPFLGLIGVAPKQPGSFTTFEPRVSGGNLDCKELVAGSTVFLPVSVPGALLYLGDGHLAQGDGEIAGTAVESRLKTRLRVRVEPFAPVNCVHALVPDGRLTFGFGNSLDEAAGWAAKNMLQWLQTLLSLDRGSAVALASNCMDLRISQVVNRGVVGVHAFVPFDVVPKSPAPGRPI